MYVEAFPVVAQRLPNSDMHSTYSFLVAVPRSFDSKGFDKGFLQELYKKRLPSGFKSVEAGLLAS